LAEVTLWREQKSRVEQQFPNLSGRRLVCEVIRHIIHVLVDDLVKETERRLLEHAPLSIDDVRTSPPLLGFSSQMREQATEMKRFLFKNLYRHPQVQTMTAEAAKIIHSLFQIYEQNPDLIPRDFRSDDEFYRRISHYIAGMTDRYANKEFQKLAV
jgi:dGTPase